MKQLHCGASIVCYILATPVAALAKTNTAFSPVMPSLKIEAKVAKDEFSVFPVKLNVGKRNVIPSIMVRGREERGRAINFESWLLPYDAVIQALNFSSFVLPNGQIELQSPGFIIGVDPEKLRNDPELGLVFSIQDLQTLFDVKAEFDVEEYAIVLTAPRLNLPSRITVPTEPAVELKGLPRIPAPDMTLSAIEQRINVSGSQTEAPSYGGNFTAVGTVLDSSWFFRVNQPNLEDQLTWELAEARIQHQTPEADYIFGSQPPFWRSQGPSEYLGFTTIQRQGFKPLMQLDGESDLRLRLQAAQIGRTISGEAEPGTLVRLAEESSDRVLAEVLVDSSGIYRFDHVLGSNYRVLLYPEGRLTAQPETEDVTFTTIPGQLPTGASALVLSAGWRRKLSENQNFLGNFSDFRGGIAQRWGLSENLTVGIGGVYDKSFRALAEVFFQPLNFPLQVAVSALTSDKWDINADINFAPSPSFYASFKSDRLSSRLNLDWQLSSEFTLLGTYNSVEGVAIGGEFASTSSNATSFFRATIDTQSRLRWNLEQRLGRLELSLQGNEIRTFSELTYNFSPTSSFNSGHSLVLNYETRNQEEDSNDVATFAWRYRSPQRAIDRNYLWQIEFGYGITSQHSGLIASLQTTVIPGLLLEARYQGVSVTSDEPTFRIELVPSFNLQRGINPGDRRANYLRTQGGLSIRFFFDHNKNGIRDTDEGFYTDSKLVLINHKPIQSLQPQVRKQRILVRLPPNTYRLDFDLDQLPSDWQATVNAYAVDVVAGSYTPVLVPLISP